MSDRQLHHGRLADNAGGRPDTVPVDRLQQARHTEAADLLIVGKGEMHRPLERCRLEAVHGIQRHRDEPLHVGGATTVELPVAFGQGEGIAGPELAVHWNHVGVARQHDAAVALGSDGRPQMGLGPGLVMVRSERIPCCSRWLRTQSISARLDFELTVSKLTRRLRISLLVMTVSDNSGARRLSPLINPESFRRRRCAR